MAKAHPFPLWQRTAFVVFSTDGGRLLLPSALLMAVSAQLLAPFMLIDLRLTTFL